MSDSKADILVRSLRTGMFAVTASGKINLFALTDIKEIFTGMKLLLLLLLALAGGWVCTLQAQHLERTVVGSAGDYHAHPTAGILHWTAGEIVVEEYQNQQVLSQGFQQGTIEIISAIDEESNRERVTVKVFPNPTSGWIQVEMDLRGNPEVILTDVLGRHLVTHTITRTGEIIDLQPLPSGIYLLRIMRKGQPIRTFRIQKVDS